VAAAAAPARLLTVVRLVEGDDAVVVAVEERHVLLQLRHAGAARARRGGSGRLRRVTASTFSIGGKPQT
jgi:hypothetical protein